MSETAKPLRNFLIKQYNHPTIRRLRTWVYLNATSAHYIYVNIFEYAQHKAGFYNSINRTNYWLINCVENAEAVCKQLPAAKNFSRFIVWKPVFTRQSYQGVWANKHHKKR